MECPDLGGFWGENKKRIGAALSVGVDEVANVLRTGADAFKLSQEVEGRYVQWKDGEGKLVIVFCVIDDPRDLDAILAVYRRARDWQASLVAVFVHQWTDGEGNWDAFVIGRRRAMQHVDRICGTDMVQERGPELRADIYELFACNKEFPAPGQDAWADLLAGSVEGVTDQLRTLAAGHDCEQTVGDYMVQWRDGEGRLQAQFFILPDSEEIDAYICMYEQIRESGCPVSFVFVKTDRARLYDIFRLSARSYLEHHNQVKVRPRLEITGDSKTLDGLRWVPRWASHVGCIKGCLDYLKCDVSDAWLFGATGHAFVLNIAGDLCPSGPTDWNTDGMLRLGRNVGFQVETVDAYCPKEPQRREAQERAFAHVQRSIDAGLPCYGWELVHPDYFVIHGYNEQGYYVSGGGCDDGAGPIPWDSLGTSEIGVVLVASVQRTEPADVRQTVREALTYALDLGHNRVKWTDGAGGLAGYDAWVKSLEAGRADGFGLSYNAVVWAECRKFAVAFLKEARNRLDDNLASLFERAITQYEIVAQNLKAISDAHPHDDGNEEVAKADEQAHSAAALLKEARDAEAAGLDVLSQLVARLK